MKLPVFVFLVLHVGFAVCEHSFIGFDLLDIKIDDLKKEMRNLIITNHNLIEEKLSTHMEDNIKLSSAQNRLKDRLHKNQKKIEEMINDMKNSCNNRLTTISLESLKNDITSTQKIIEEKIVSLAKEIDEKNVKITNSLDVLVELVRKNQNNTENVFTNISKPTDSVDNSMTNAVKNETQIEKKIEHLTPKVGEEHSKEHLDKEYDMLIKTCRAFVTGTFRMEKLNKTIYCKNGWIVIQQRIDGKLDFNRSWAEYRDGFGTVGKDNEFWLGLETIHQLTKVKKCLLFIAVSKIEHWLSLQLTGNDDMYRFKNESYKNILRDPKDNFQFTTYDSDNDLWSEGNCAQKYGMGWWFDRCSDDNHQTQEGWRIEPMTKHSNSNMMINC